MVVRIILGVFRAMLEARWLWNPPRHDWPVLCDHQPRNVSWAGGSRVHAEISSLIGVPWQAELCEVHSPVQYQWVLGSIWQRDKWVQLLRLLTVLCYIDTQVSAIPLKPIRLAAGKQSLKTFRRVKQCFNYVPPDWKLAIGSASIKY